MSVESVALPNRSIRVKILHRLLHDLVLSFSLILLLEISEHLLFLEDLLLLLLNLVFDLLLESLLLLLYLILKLLFFFYLSL